MRHATTTHIETDTAAVSAQSTTAAITVLNSLVHVGHPVNSVKASESVPCVRRTLADNTVPAIGDGVDLIVPPILMSAMSNVTDAMDHLSSNALNVPLTPASMVRALVNAMQDGLVSIMTQTHLISQYLATQTISTISSIRDTSMMPSGITYK